MYVHTCNTTVTLGLCGTDGLCICVYTCQYPCSVRSIAAADGYADVDYSGTWQVNGDDGDDYIGFVFGYQSNRKFYIVVMKQQHSNYGGTAYRGGLRGLQLKVLKHCIRLFRILGAGSSAIE